MSKNNIYKATVNLLINGETIAVGETVELDDATAERMSEVVELVHQTETMTIAEHADHHQILIDNDKAFSENQERK